MNFGFEIMEIFNKNREVVKVKLVTAMKAMLHKPANSQISV